jgi:predicted O-methyltransferase YrrM
MNPVQAVPSMLKASVKAAGRVVARALKRRFIRAAAGGAPWGLPWSFWRTLYPDRWQYFRTSLVDDAEEEARRVIAVGHPLGRLLSAADLRNPWALSPVTLLTLRRLLQQRRPATVVEMGSGLSTLVIALHASDCASAGQSPPAFVSLEHDGQWLEVSQSRLERAGLAQYVRLVHAPLQESGGVTTYARGAVAEALASREVDFCLVDGPPGNIGRAPCLPLVEPYMADFTTVLLDDFVRASERAVLASFLARGDGAITRLQCKMTERGLAICDWRKPPGGGSRSEPGLESRLQAAVGSEGPPEGGTPTRLP